MATRLITTTTQHGSATARPGALARPPSEEAPETATTAGISLTDAVDLVLAAHWSSSGGVE